MAETRLAGGESTGRPGIETRRQLEEIVAPPRPLLRPAPRSTMFFPLAMVAAILPGLYALNWWDLNPPGPWWGLRGLAVLEGHVLDQVPLLGLGPEMEAQAYRDVALQPPLYAWLEALSLKLSPDRNPLATVLPSYAAGALVVILVYLHGRLWLGRGVGLTAAVLTAFNPQLLIQMQQATPSTVGLTGVLGGLLCYGQYLASGEGRRWHWALLGGLGLGVTFLSVGFLGFIPIPIVLLHQAVLTAEADSRWTSGNPRWRVLLHRVGFWSGIVALGLALLLAGPWYGMMLGRYGMDFVTALWIPVRSGLSEPQGLVLRLVELAPVTLPLSLLALVRGVRQVLAAEESDGPTLGVAFWIVWLAVAAITPALVPNGSESASLALLLLVPLNLLAAQAMADLAARRIPARNLIWLAPASALSVAWWLSSDLRGAVADVLAWRRPDALTVLRLHVGLDLLILLVVATRQLDRWARRRDGRRRLILGLFLVAVLTVTASAGLREVHFRHQETSDLLGLREAIVHRERVKPFTLLAVVSPEYVSPPGQTFRPAGRLRFLLRATLPDLTPLNLNRVEDLMDLPNPPGGQRLILVVGPDQRLPYPLQSQLGLESFFTAGREGVLEAFASTLNPPRRIRRRPDSASGEPAEPPREPAETATRPDVPDRRASDRDAEPGDSS